MRLDRRLIGASIGLLALTGLGLYLALAAPYLANFRAVISLRRQAAALARRAGWVKGYGAPFFPLAVETTNQAGVYEYALFGQFEAVEGETLFLLGRGGRRLGVRLDNPDGQPLPAFIVKILHDVRPSSIAAHAPVLPARGVTNGCQADKRMGAASSAHPLPIRWPLSTLLSPTVQPRVNREDR